MMTFQPLDQPWFESRPLFVLRKYNFTVNEKLREEGFILDNLNRVSVDLALKKILLYLEPTMFLYVK